MAWHHEMLARDGVAGLFDATLSSSEMAVAKPHPAAFTGILARLGGPAAGDCLFVADRLFEDIGGAQAIGMHTVALPDHTVAAEHRVAAQAVPSFRIAGLDGLVDVVDRWRAALRGDGAEEAPGPEHRTS